MTSFTQAHLPPPMQATQPPAPTEAQGQLPEAMDTSGAPPSTLPDVPLIGPIMDRLLDEEDLARTLEDHRGHIRALVSTCPCVFATYAKASSRPPGPGVRSALRQLEGLPASHESEDPPPVAAATPLRRGRRSQGSRGPRQPIQPPLDQLPARKLRPRRPTGSGLPWHHPSRLPTASTAASSTPSPPGRPWRRRA